MAKQFTLGKNERLKSRKLIEQLFSEGKSFVVNPFKLFYRIIPVTYSNSELSTYNLQFGVGVSTKNFKKAVDRNRVKRIIREAYRLQKQALQKKMQAQKIALNIFFIYTAKELPLYKDVYGKMDLILTKLNKIADEIK
jgi:ribonuclease P protein component